MCILLSVNLIWCNSITYIYGQLEGGTSAISICALCYMLNIFGVVVFHTSMVNCSGGYICPKLYVHCAICDTYSMQWYSIHLWSIGGGGLIICAFCYLLIFLGVVVFIHLMSIGGYSICPMYMFIVLYMKHVECSGIQYISGQLRVEIHLPSVYVHSGICMKLYLVQWYSIDLQSFGGGGLGICAFFCL